MTALLKREPKTLDVFDRFDRMLDEWTRTLPLRWAAWTGTDWPATDVIRVDEYRRNGDLVIRAELPGIDPDKDVEVTVADGMLHITAERREEERTEDDGWIRRELRRGSFSRSLPLPEGVAEDDIAATYRDGILEIVVPVPATETPAKKVEIKKG